MASKYGDFVRSSPGTVMWYEAKDPVDRTTTATTIQSYATRSKAKLKILSVNAFDSNHTPMYLLRLEVQVSGRARRKRGVKPGQGKVSGEESPDRAHLFYTPEDFQPGDQSGLATHVILGDLKICKRCGLAEGDLTTHCPGAKLEPFMMARIQEDNMDFVSGRWRSRPDKQRTPLRKPGGEKL